MSGGHEMKIVSVEYRRLRSFGEYENEAVGAVAEVGTEHPEDVLETLKSWVEQNFGERASARDAESRVRRSERRLMELNALIREAGKRWEGAQRVLAAAGVDVPKDWHADDLDLEELPF